MTGTGKLEAWLRQAIARVATPGAAHAVVPDRALIAIGAATQAGATRLLTLIAPLKGLSHRMPRPRPAPSGIERRRRARLPGSVVLALKCGIGAGGLWLAASVASLVGDLAASPRPDLAVTTPAAETQTGGVRRIETTLWQPITRPAAFLGIASPELDGLAVIHEARRNAAGIREDLAGHGPFEGDRPHLQLITRIGPAEEHGRSFVIDTVRRAAQLGLSADRVAQPVALATKLGPFETADVLLSVSGEQRACVAFRGPGAEMPLTLQGWWCGTAQRPADRQQLACLIDRLVLTQGGEAGELRPHFTAAELRRDERCNPPRLAQAGRKPTWLDADATALPLRSAPKPAEAPDRTRPRKSDRRG